LWLRSSYCWGLGVGSTLIETASAATPKTPPKTYTVTRTVGPFSGTDTSLGDREALSVWCTGATDSILSESAKIVRKTSHGTASRDVVTLDVLGAYWDSEVDLLKWGTFIGATGKSGWNSVTLTITCHR
jgi:hypothetical protein